MSKEIYKAVANLPEELITPEIAAAAIEEGKIELLDYLPHKYLTGEVVVGVIEKNADSYSFRSFNLSSLPEDIRTKDVCEFAVKKDDSNIVHVPSELRSSKMLERILNSTKRNIKHLFSVESWTIELALKGTSSIYSETTSNYGPRGGYHGTTTKTDINRVQIFLSFVPDSIKTKEFYLGLFGLNMKRDEIDILIPKNHKDKAYYLNVAASSFKLVPKSFYDYDIFMAAIENREVRFELPYSYGSSRVQQQEEREAHEKLMEAVFAVMDDAMADKAIEVEQCNFKRIPKQFQTPERLINAIEISENRNVVLIDQDCYGELFTKDVCRAYIRKNDKLPKLPKSIWTNDFVAYCEANGTEYKWFEQLPKELQTVEMVAKAIEANSSYVEFARPEFISPEQAIDLYRNHKWAEKYIPKHYITDFINETGLDDKFYGGEVSYWKLREERKQHTYCRLGNSYLSIHQDGNGGYYNSYSGPYIITLTRRSPRSFKPEVVFRQEVATFHTTWLEKMISDYDPTFVKPSVSKALKPYQENGYFTLKRVESEFEAEIYANELLGEQIYFATMINGERFSSNKLEIIKDELRAFYDDSSIDFGEPILQKAM